MANGTRTGSPAAAAAPRELDGYEPTSRPIWLEALFPLDWVALHASPVYYGFGVPRGNGEPVVLVPGFLGSDRYLTEMHLWLRRIGYKPYFSGIGRNVDCPELLTQRLLVTIQQAHAETHMPVTIIGHSMGGVVARYYVQVLGGDARVHTLVTLGSPHGGTYPARLVPHPLARQLRPGSEIIRELSGPAPGCSTRFVAFWSDVPVGTLPPDALGVNYVPLTKASEGPAYMPEPSSSENAIDRAVHLDLALDGGVKGDAMITMKGPVAAERRRRLSRMSADERRKSLEQDLQRYMPTAVLAVWLPCWV